MAITLLKFSRTGGRTVWRRALRDCGRRAAGGHVACSADELRQLQGPARKIYYKDTQNLVSLVEDAASLIETKGDEAFKEFSRKNSKWLNSDYYLFAYTLDGTTVFHPLRPELVGQNVMDLKDMNGKQIIRQITNIGRRPAKDASGWVFYLWEDQTQLTPTWKAAYIRKVVTPDLKTYVIGSGSYSIKVEKAFVEERVERAAACCKVLERPRRSSDFVIVPRRFSFSIRTFSSSTSKARQWSIRPSRTGPAAR